MKKLLAGEINFIIFWRKRIKKISGTKIGGAKAREANYTRYGKDFYRKIGRIGGMRGNTGGFAANPQLAREAGKKGGMKSRRGPNSLTKTEIEPQAAKIEKLYYAGNSIPQIAKQLNLPYSSLLRWAKSNIIGYGAADDIERYEQILEHEREVKRGRNTNAS